MKKTNILVVGLIGGIIAEGFIALKIISKLCEDNNYLNAQFEELANDMDELELEIREIDEDFIPQYRRYKNRKERAEGWSIVK